jgi:hypothetical protein
MRYGAIVGEYGQAWSGVATVGRKDAAWALAQVRMPSPFHAHAPFQKGLAHHSIRLAFASGASPPCRFRKLRPFDSRSLANQNMIAA